MYITVYNSNWKIDTLNFIYSFSDKCRSRKHFTKIKINKKYYNFDKLNR